MAHDHDHHGHDHDHGHDIEGESPIAHHHDCGNLFGCGDEQGTGIVREDIKDGAYQRYTGDASVPGQGEILLWQPQAS